MENDLTFALVCYFLLFITSLLWCRPPFSFSILSFGAVSSFMTEETRSFGA